MKIDTEKEFKIKDVIIYRLEKFNEVLKDEIRIAKYIIKDPNISKYA